MWTELAQAAQRRGELDLIESRYAADGRRINLAYLVADDLSTVIALTGDPDAPGWQVIGHYLNEYAAGQALPAPVPPGVLRADVSQFNRPEPVPEVPLQELLRDVVEAQRAGIVSDALLTAAQHGPGTRPMNLLQELLNHAGQFASAMDTVQGCQIASRLDALARQTRLPHPRSPRGSRRPRRDRRRTTAEPCPQATAPPVPLSGTQHPPTPPRSTATARHR